MDDTKFAMEMASRHDPYGINQTQEPGSMGPLIQNSAVSILNEYNKNRMVVPSNATRSTHIIPMRVDGGLGLVMSREGECLIEHVKQGSNGEDAGLRDLDLLVKIGTADMEKDELKVIEDNKAFAQFIRNHPNKMIKLEIVRFELPENFVKDNMLKTVQISKMLTDCAMYQIFKEQVRNSAAPL